MCLIQMAIVLSLICQNQNYPDFCHRGEDFYRCDINSNPVSTLNQFSGNFVVVVVVVVKSMFCISKAQ